MRRLCCAVHVLLGSLIVFPLNIAAQGTVNFENHVIRGGQPLVDAPIFLFEGGPLLDGPAYLALLLGGANQAALTPAGSPVPFFGAPQAGYFRGELRTIPDIAPGSSAFVRVIAWERTLGETYEAALSQGTLGSGIGQSEVLFLAKTGDPTLGGAPSLPADLEGLKSFSIYNVPEPSTLCLFLGLVLLALCRWRR